MFVLLLLILASFGCSSDKQTRLVDEIVGHGFLEEEVASLIKSSWCLDVCFEAYVAHSDGSECRNLSRGWYIYQFDPDFQGSRFYVENYIELEAAYMLGRQRDVQLRNKKLSFVGVQDDYYAEVSLSTGTVKDKVLLKLTWPSDRGQMLSQQLLTSCHYVPQASEEVRSIFVAGEELVHKACDGFETSVIPLCGVE